MTRKAEGILKLWRHEGGNVALAFGLALVPMIGAAGIAVDVQSASNARTVLQAEADAAALEVMKAAAEIHTSAANANKTILQRQTMIDAKASQITTARKALAQSRLPTGRTTNFAFTGEWADTLKTEYRFTANADVARYIKVNGITNNGGPLAVAVSATAKMEVDTETSTSIPTIDRPGYEAGDYNRIYVYCYNEARKAEADGGRSKMTAVSSNGTKNGVPETSYADVFKNVTMPACTASETMSWRLYNVRGAREDWNRWPKDSKVANTSPQLWSQTDANGEKTSGPIAGNGARTIYNFFSDTKVDAQSGVESYQFNGNQLGYMSGIGMMETVVCSTQQQCTPGAAGNVIPSGKNRGQPQTSSTKCEPGKFMYMGWEDRPVIPGRTNAEYNDWNSGYWTDADYDDIRLVIACPQTKITKYESTVRLIK